MRPFIALAFILATIACSRDDRAAPAAKPATPSGAVAEATAPNQTAGVEYLQTMRGQFAKIAMETETDFLNDEERRVVNLLNEVGRLMSEIYFRQIAEENPVWRAKVQKSAGPEAALLRDLYDLHFGPWDTLNEDRAFWGGHTRPPGSGFYPADMTKDEFENWIAAHPGDEASFRSPYTVIRRTADGGLNAIAYSEHYREWLEPAAAKLREAAEITSNSSLKSFLNLRAAAFLNDEYFESELAWMDLDGRIEAAIGPYEVYDDRLFGLKTAFEAFIAVVDPDESAALDNFKRLLRDMEANLPVAERYKNFKRGFESPISVATQVHGGGDNVPGVQTIAFNLPNDERVREAKGAKKVLLSNVMAAKFDRVLAPMSERILVPEQASLLRQKYMGTQTLFHELAHSLGPGTIVKNGRETSVSAELQELYSGTEEGKADVMGAYNVLYMMALGELPAAEKEEFLATYFAGLFRSMRFGLGAAHAKGAAFQYSFFKEMGAFSIDEDTGLFRVDFVRLEEAIAALTQKIVVVQGDGDYAAAAAFLQKYAVMDDDVRRVIASLGDIPVDIQPIYPERL